MKLCLKKCVRTRCTYVLYVKPFDNACNSWSWSKFYLGLQQRIGHEIKLLIFTKSVVKLDHLTVNSDEFGFGKLGDVMVQ